MSEVNVPGSAAFLQQMMDAHKWENLSPMQKLWGILRAQADMFLDHLFPNQREAHYSDLILKDGSRIALQKRINPNGKPGGWVAPGTEVDPTAYIGRFSSVGPGVRVGPGARIPWHRKIGPESNFPGVFPL